MTPKVGKRLLERKPKSLNRYYKAEKKGLLTYIEIPPPPHPLAAQCPTCWVRPGEPCVDGRKHMPWDRRHEAWLDQPHPDRARWAVKMVGLLERDTAKEGEGDEGGPKENS